ncbi:MAG: nucleoside-diphosphate kinase [Minisyncoccia bacterium]|jgi:nucleoside-diphosphate kinase
MSIETTLVLLKPDAIEMGADVIDGIKKKYESSGLSIVKSKFLRFAKSAAREFYLEHAGKFYFPGLVLAITSGPSLALLLQGESAVALVRKLNGATDPRSAAPGTIRHDFQSAGGPFNTVHGSDSVKSAIRERRIVFGEE